MKNELPESSKQTVKFFEDLVRKKDVVEFIKDTRKRLNLPENGIEYTDEDERIFSSDDELKTWYTPERAIKLMGRTKTEVFATLYPYCNGFLVKKGIKSFYISQLLRLYLIFNKIIPAVFEDMFLSDDLLKIETLSFRLSYVSEESHDLLKIMYHEFSELSKEYPVVLYINPNVSQRQLIDFISKKWWFIRMIKEKSETLDIGKPRQKRKQTRNDFIYKNRNIPIAQIRKKIIQEFGEFLDDGHIGKILQLERKKRN